MISEGKTLDAYLRIFKEVEGGEKLRIRKAIAKGQEIGIIEAVLPKGALASVQIFMLQEKLSEKGEVIATIPNGEEINEGKFHGDLATLMTYNNPEEVLSVFKEVSKTAPVLTPITIEDLEIVDSGKIDLVDITENQQVDTLISKVEDLILDQNSVTVGGSGGEAASGGQIEEVKVKVNDLNELFQRIEELVLIRNRYIRLWDTKDFESLREVNTTLDRTTNDLYTKVLKMRLTNLDQIFNFFKKSVAEQAQSLGKEVDFIISGESVSVDRAMLEELIGPISALLSNAVEHGLESTDVRRSIKKLPVGTVRLNAHMEEEAVVITVEDDGKGLDVEQIKNLAYKKGLVGKSMLETISAEEAMNLIFLPGFSTREFGQTTSEMGLTAIKQRIESHGGSLEVSGEAVKGSKFTLVMPTNMTIQRVLLFKLGELIVATPSSMIASILPGKQVQAKAHHEGVDLLEYREKVIPLYDLNKLLKLESDYEDRYGIILQRRNKVCCVTGSDVLGFEEVVVKSLENNKFLDMPWMMGTTILSDGRATPILDILSLVQSSQ
jgi:two-component system chemotaxis sensor kinase CheA